MLKLKELMEEKCKKSAVGQAGGRKTAACADEEEPGGKTARPAPGGEPV
jgi:hypothetical protein